MIYYFESFITMLFELLHCNCELLPIILQFMNFHAVMCLRRMCKYSCAVLKNDKEVKLAVNNVLSKIKRIRYNGQIPTDLGLTDVCFFTSLEHLYIKGTWPYRLDFDVNNVQVDHMVFHPDLIPTSHTNHPGHIVTHNIFTHLCFMHLNALQTCTLDIERMQVTDTDITALVIHLRELPNFYELRITNCIITCKQALDPLIIFNEHVRVQFESSEHCETSTFTMIFRHKVPDALKHEYSEKYQNMF